MCLRPSPRKLAAEMLVGRHVTNIGTMYFGHGRMIFGARIIVPSPFTHPRRIRLVSPLHLSFCRLAANYQNYVSLFE